jgi:hypothetical protein
MNGSILKQTFRNVVITVAFKNLEKSLHKDTSVTPEFISWELSRGCVVSCLEWCQFLEIKSQKPNGGLWCVYCFKSLQMHLPQRAQCWDLSWHWVTCLAKTRWSAVQRQGAAAGSCYQCFWVVWSTSQVLLNKLVIYTEGLKCAVGCKFAMPDQGL